MATLKSRTDRGRESEFLVADRWRDGWPHARARSKGAPGADLEGTPGVDVEVKARRGFSPKEWARQQSARSDGLVPVCIIRPDGMGPASVDDWPAMTTHGWIRRLLRMAGYGDPLPEEPLA